jgi:hypothetical protein
LLNVLCRGRVRETDPDMLRWHVGIAVFSKEKVSPRHGADR